MVGNNPSIVYGLFLFFFLERGMRCEEMERLDVNGFRNSVS